MRITGLILAAGLSSRINSFKPILHLNKKPFVNVIAEKLLKVCSDLVIVTGYKSDIILEIIKDYFQEETLRIKLTYNEDFEKGMLSSLQKGISSAKNSDWILFHFVDQPTIPEKFYFDFIDQIKPQFNWIQPSINSCKGHPILINNTLYNLILSLPSNESLRTFKKNKSVKQIIWNCNYPDILKNINSEEDYKNIL
ncbi:MAG: hypothetical protein FJ214_06940 [Ignavibacteria bacterium]|nr:hypothetical protein [Ignavibacteria bacterium]